MVLIIRRYLKSIRVFHACMTATMGFVYCCYMDAYSSPNEDAILKEGLMTIDGYSLFATSPFISGSLASLVVGTVNEFLGIKTSLLIFSQLGTLGAMLLVLGHDSISMIAGRFLIGIYTAACVTGVPVYNAQVATDSTRKFYGGILGFSMRFGMLLCNFLGIWLGYRWLAVIYIMMVVLMNLNLVFLPESPVWLRNKGWIEKANKADEFFYDSPKESSPLIATSASVELVRELANDTLSQKISSYLKWPIIRPLLVCCSIQIAKSFSGGEYLLAYSAHTLDNAVSINPRVAAFLYPISLVIGSTIYLLISHKVSWKWLLFVTTFFQLFANVMMSLTFYLSIQKYHCVTNTQDVILCEILQIMPMIFVVIYGLSFSLGWGSLIWWLYGHILHSKYQNVSVGIITFLLYSSCIIIQYIFPLIEEHLGRDILFLVFAVINLIGFIIQFWY